MAETTRIVVRAENITVITKVEMAAARATGMEATTAARAAGPVETTAVRAAGLAVTTAVKAAGPVGITAAVM